MVGEQPQANGAVSNGISAKAEVLTDIAKKVKALDNPVKLNILSSLVESGSLSITDIAKKLSINFSTAHKYLEQLQAAGLVTSRQISDNRLKRMFFVKDFCIELSPKNLFQNFSAINHEHNVAFKLFNEHGKLVDFDEDKFAQKYTKRGMPRGTVILALQEVLPQAYDGITLLELRDMFRRTLEKKSENISTVISQIDADLQHKRTFQHIIHMAHPSALQKHMSGEIFIQNLRSPRLQNFVFGLDRINIHGTTGKVPKTLAEFFKDILYLANYVSSFTEPVFGIDGLNHYAAKFVKNLEKNQLVKEFTAFLEELAKLGRFYVSVELGKPRYVEDAEYDAKTSEELGKILLNIMAKANQNIYPIVKIWDKKRLRDDFSFLPRFYLVNMLPKWQTDNVSIVGESRFDYSWRGLYGTGKVGEMQNIAVNLPRLALKSKNTEEFMKNLELLISECIECHLNMMELTVGEFLRKHKTLLPSGTRGHWRIVAASDCSYAVSIAGLNEVLEILRKKGGKNIDPNTVLKHCLSSMKVRDATPIRLVLREDCDETITKRFYELDSRSFPEAKSSKQYSVGVACGDFEEGGHCHKLLLGGHVHKMSKQEYLKALTKLDKTEFGCIFVK